MKPNAPATSCKVRSGFRNRMQARSLCICYVTGRWVWPAAASSRLNVRGLTPSCLAAPARAGNRASSWLSKYIRNGSRVPAGRASRSRRCFAESTLTSGRRRRQQDVASPPATSGHPGPRSRAPRAPGYAFPDTAARPNATASRGRDRLEEPVCRLARAGCRVETARRAERAESACGRVEQLAAPACRWPSAPSGVLVQAEDRCSREP